MEQGVFDFLDIEVEKTISTINELENLEEEGKVENDVILSKNLYKTDSFLWKSLASRESIFS